MKLKQYIDMMLSEYKITHIEGLTKCQAYRLGDGLSGLMAFEIRMVGSNNIIAIITHGHTTKLYEQMVSVPYDRNDESITTYHQKIGIWNKLVKQKQNIDKLIAKI